MKPRNKKTVRYNHESDSSSDSDSPLIKLQSSLIKNNLFKYSVEKCEFCDKVFYNKYNILVHNAKHIIIPLLNQKLYKCSQCQCHFNSVESLEWHSMKSHSYVSNEKGYLPKLLQSFVKREPMMQLTKEPLFSKDSNTVNGESPAQIITNNEQNNVPEILQSLVLKKPVTMLTKLTEPIITSNKDILQSLVKREPVTLLEKVSFEIENGDINDSIAIYDSENEDERCSDVGIKTKIAIVREDDEDTRADINTKTKIAFVREDDEDTRANIDTKTKIEFEYSDSDSENSKNPKIKDRIQFEDDDDEEILEIDSLGNVGNPVHAKTKDIVSDNLGNTPNVSEYVGMESIHNDDLKKPGLYRCKKCSKMFPNRYEAIIHETKHIKFKRRNPYLCRYCDWYVATSPMALIRHKKLRHPERVVHNPKKKFKKCKDCNLTYINWFRHRQNYHFEFKCVYCDKLFQTEGERYEHKLEHTNHTLAEQKVGPEKVMWLIRTVKVCEFCYQWFKERSNLKYQHVKNYFKLGERSQCERCEKLYFELRVVRMRMKKVNRDPLKYVNKEKDLYEVKKLKKPLSNTDRLKNVQMRLKKLKLMNKF